jgi:Tol biopolymer transport system component
MKIPRTRGKSFAAVLLAALLLAAVPAAALADGPSIPISGPMPPDGYISSYRVSADTVVFKADVESGDGYAFYSVPITGGTRVRLSPVTPFDDFYWKFEIVPGQQRLVYSFREDGRLRLFSTPLDSETPVRLHSATDGTEYDFALTPDGQTVVYLSRKSSEQPVLYRAAVNGTGQEELLSATYAEKGQVRDFSIAPDGKWVVWRQGQVNGWRLYARSLVQAGAPIVELSTGLNSVLDLRGGTAFSPDGTRVAFIGQATGPGADAYAAPLAGPAAARVMLNPTLAQTRTVSFLAHWTPDGNRVIYNADADTTNLIEIYGADANGSGTAVKLNAPVTSNAFPWLLQSGQLLYDVREGTQTVFYTLPSSGSAADARRLSANTGQWLNAGNLFVYEHWVEKQVYAVAAGGPEDARVSLNGSGPFCLDAGGRYAVVNRTAEHKLYRVKTSGVGAGDPVSAEMRAGTQIDSCRIVGGGTRVVYFADERVAGQFELFAASFPADQLYTVYVPLLLR